MKKKSYFRPTSGEKKKQRWKLTKVFIRSSDECPFKAYIVAELKAFLPLKKVTGASV